MKPDILWKLITGIPLLLLTAGVNGIAAAPDTLELVLEKAVYLDHEGVMNISGIAADGNGRLFFSDDHGPSPAEWGEENPVLLATSLEAVLGTTSGRVKLERVEASGVRFDYASPAHKLGKIHKYDLEGVAVRPGGRLWAVDERDRLILDFNPSDGCISLVTGPEQLVTPWTELSETGINTALEGLAVIGNRLFLAWEMRPALVLVYRMEGGSLIPEKKITVRNTLDLNDLSADKGFLYALGRTNSEVFKIDPAAGGTIGVARFKSYADSGAYRYANHPEYYNSEGLAVTGRYILVVLDGNMQPIRGNGEVAPLLLVFRRPEGF